MTHLAIIVAIWAIMLIIAFVFLPAWRKRHDAGKGLYARSQDDNKLSVNYALKVMNCKVKWTDDHEDLVARYTYQGGHFNIRLEKDSPYVRLSYFYFFEAGSHDLELVRNVCNQCNLNTETCRIVYTLNNDSGMVDVHIVCSLMITDSTVTEVLERAMANTFKWQNVFVRRFNEMKSANDKVPNRDLEKAQATLERELFLLREQEMIHQEAGPDWHLGQGENSQLGHLLATTMGLKDIVPAHFALYADNSSTSIDDTDAILNFDITQPIIADGAFGRLSAMARLDYYDPRDPVKMRHLTLDFEQEGATTDTLYYRITLSLAPVSPANGVEVASRTSPKRQVSVLLGYDLTPKEERMTKFRYLWKEAMAKANGRGEQLNKEEQLLCDMQNPNMGWLALNGKALFDQKRYYEAISLLEALYAQFASIEEATERLGRDKCRELYFFLGVSYGAIGQYEKSIYYLQQADPFEIPLVTEAYVNSLVNQKDHRALATIDMLLRFLREISNNATDENDEEKTKTNLADDQLDHISNFLLRRKAYMLVAMQRYDEAERLLKQMLDNPQNSDFALKELAYIQKNKGK